MNETDGKELVATLQTLKSQAKPWRFVYLAAGSDGGPELLVQKVLPQAKVVEMRQAAKNKTLWTTGWIAASPDRRSFVFHPEVEPPTKFARDLAQGELGKVSRLLKVSSVAETGTEPGPAPRGPDVDTARDVSREETKKASGAQREAQDKEQATQIAISRHVDLNQRLGESHFARKNAEEDIDKRQKLFDAALAGVENLKGKWFKKDAKKAAAEKLETERGKLDALRQSLLTAMTTQKLATEQLKEIHELMDEAEVATLRAEKARAVAARARATTATALAVKSESDAAEKERGFAEQLKLAAKKDPELAKAIDLAATRDAQARQAVSAAMYAMDVVGKLEAKLAEAPEEEQAAVELELEKAQEELKQALARAKEATDASTQAAKDRELTITQSAKGPLAAALKDRTDARAARDEADQQEVLALRNADEAEETVERNVTLRKPKIVIEGLSKANFQMLVSFLPLGDPLTRVDFEKQRVGIGYDALAYSQQNKLAVQMLDGIPPMKGHPIPKTAARFAACWGGVAYKEELEERKAKASKAGQDMVDEFDWEARKLEMAGKEDELELAITGKTPKEVVTKLLSGDSPGALFGESHSDPQTQNFLVDNFDTFVECGVDTVYVEHIAIELQPMFDAWLASETPEMPAPLQKALYAIQVVKDQYPRNLVGLLEKAKAAGMNIQGIDTTAAKGDLDHTCDTDKTERVRRMNALAGDTMKNDPKRKGKFIALTGAAHNTPHKGSPKPVPGVADLLGILPVELDSNGKVTVDRGDPTLRP